MRLALWFGFIASLVVIETWPLRWTLDASDIQTLRVLVNPVAFGIIFTLWFAGFVVLMLGSTKDFERFLLLFLFAFVFLSYWAVRAQNGVQQDEYSNMGIVQFILNSGSVTGGTPNTAYLDYPGLFVIGSILTEVLGISLAAFRQLLLLLFTGLMVGGLFTIFRRLFKRALNPAIFTTFAVVSSLVWVRVIEFTPFFLGILLLMAIILCLLGGQLSLSTVLIAGLMVSYLPNSILLTVILGFLVAFELIGYGARPPRHFGLLVYSCVAFLGWNVFWAYSQFGSVLYFFRQIQFGSVPTALDIVTNIPLWAKLVEYIWIVGILGVGSIIALYGTLRIRNKLPKDRLLIAGSLGTALFGFVSFVVVPGGVQLPRLMFYAPLFFAPLAAVFLSERIKRKKLYVIFLLGIISLSFPTFLVQDRAISMSVVYNYEIGLGSFARFAMPTTSGYVTTDQITGGVLQFYLPDAVFSTPPWNFSELSSSFGSFSGSTLVVSARAFTYLSFVYGNNQTNQFVSHVWNVLRNNNVVYNSGFAQIAESR